MSQNSRAKANNSPRQYQAIISPRFTLPKPCFLPCLEMTLSVSAVCPSVACSSPYELSANPTEGYGYCIVTAPAAGEGWSHHPRTLGHYHWPAAPEEQGIGEAQGQTGSLRWVQAMEEPRVTSLGTSKSSKGQTGWQRRLGKKLPSGATRSWTLL